MQLPHKVLPQTPLCNETLSLQISKQLLLLLRPSPTSNPALLLSDNQWQSTSKAELKEYLRRLGKPVLGNVSDDQCDDAIDYAIQKFQTYHYEGAERVYLKHLFTAAEVTAGKTNTNSLGKDGTTQWSEQNTYLSVPDHVTAVEGIFTFTDKGTRNMFDIRYQMRLNDLYDFTSTVLSLLHDPTTPGKYRLHPGRYETDQIQPGAEQSLSGLRLV